MRRDNPAVKLRQLRFVIEKFQLARRTSHMQIDDPLGAWSKLRRQSRQGVVGSRFKSSLVTPSAEPSTAEAIDDMADASVPRNIEPNPPVKESRK
jgi:hypothetical protein